jgi:hypothetical protein
MAYKIEAECPNCGEKADGLDQIESLFGFRVVAEKRIPQSWCRHCRKK